MKILVNNKKNLLILAIIGMVFFFIYSFLPLTQINWHLQNPSNNFDFKFNTPDEVVNYYFSQHYARTGDLYYTEPLDGLMNRVVFPRWALVITHTVTPGNFIGIDLIYGSLAKIFSVWVVPFLTPLLAVIGVLFFYLLIKEFFKKRIAFVSACLMFVFPAWWYYSSRTMFHNVLFLSLLIIGLYFLIKLFNSEKQRLIKAILTGLFFGGALINRTSEIFWVFLIILVFLIFNWKKIFNINHPLTPSFKRRGGQIGLWPYLVLSLIIFIACFIPVLYHNKILYNNYLATGYNLNTMTENLESGEVGKLSLIKAVVLPFGFHPKVIYHVIKNYIVRLFWPWIILFIVGLVYLLKDIKQQTQKIKNKTWLYLSLLLITYYLLLIYGSWYFHDSLNLNLFSLGSSYVRYLLPVFIFSLPVVAYLWIKVWQRKLFYKILILIISVCLLIFTFNQVYYSNDEALLAVKDNLIKNQEACQNLLKYIAEDEIILVSQAADKVLFPQRKHLIVPQNGVEWPEIKKIIPQGIPNGINYKQVWYFEQNSKLSLAELNQNKFNPQGLEIYDEILISPNGKLYKIRNK